MPIKGNQCVLSLGNKATLRRITDHLGKAEQSCINGIFNFFAQAEAMADPSRTLLVFVGQESDQADMLLSTELDQLLDKSPIPRLCRLIAFFVLCIPTLVFAEDSEQRPLVASFIPISPYAQLDADGKRRGFLIELANELGREIGVDVGFQDVSDSREFIENQINGTTQIIAGVAKLPPLQSSNVFSNPVATETLQLAVLTGNVNRFDGEIQGFRIGIVPPAVGSEVQELLNRNETVELKTPEAAVMNLITGKVDAILLPNPAVVSISRASAVDYRIAFVGDVLRSFDRFVAIHNSRAELLPEINKAIARMEADGRLAELRERYFIKIPPPPPRVFSVGIAHFPPHMIVEDDGSISGFVPDAMRDIAELADIDIQFRTLDQATFVQGPGAAEVDMIAGLVDTISRRELMDFTSPVRQVPIEAAALATKDQGMPTRDNLAGHRIGVLSGSVAEHVASSVRGAEVVELQGAEVVELQDNESALDELLEGRLDSVLAVSNTLPEIARMKGLTAEFEFSAEPITTVDTAIALRFGLTATRNRLNAVIPGYLLSDGYKEVSQKYYGDPVYWTRDRIVGAVTATVLLFLTMLSGLIWQYWRRREDNFKRQAIDLRKEKAHSAQLGQLVSDLEQSNREQAEFTYAISHDLKSPTNTMGMLIEELGSLGAVGEGGHDVLSDMRSTNSRMGNLITDVLDYSRIVEEELCFERINLNSVFDEIIEDLASDISEAKADVSRGTLPIVLGHKMQIRVLLQNLVANAIKFRLPDRQPVVRISAGSRGENTIVTVTDNGIGIPLDKRETIFGLFKRIHKRSDFTGTGLGLAICRRVMTNHNGAISCRESADGGTAFDMEFRNKAA